MAIKDVSKTQLPQGRVKSQGTISILGKDVTNPQSAKEKIKPQKTIEILTPETTPTTNPTPKEIGYKYAGKKPMIQSIKDITPKQFIPTKIMGAIFGGIFILVLIIAALQFPFSSMMSGNVDITINIGYPWAFLELELTGDGGSPLRPLALILDIILYAIIAYMANVIINLMLKNPLLQSKEELKQKPTIFKDRKITQKKNNSNNNPNKNERSPSNT